MPINILLNCLVMHICNPCIRIEVEELGNIKRLSSKKKKKGRKKKHTFPSDTLAHMSLTDTAPAVSTQ